MSVCPVLPWPHPTLAKPSAKVVIFDAHIRKICDDLAETCQAAGAVAMSAVQIGALAQIVYVSRIAAGAPLILINPVLEERGALLQHHRESCASTPGIIIDMQRSASIKVAARSARGDEVAFRAECALAQIIQHELNHLEGKTIIDCAKKAKLWFYRERMKKFGGAHGDVLDYRTVRPDIAV